MNRNLQYISQLSQQDLDDIESLIHIHAGSGIIITRTSEGLEISIDKQYVGKNLIDKQLWWRRAL